MKRICSILLALCLLAGCAPRVKPSAPVAESSAPSSSAVESEPEPTPEPEPEEPDYNDPAVLLRTFFTPYGNLIYQSDGWNGYEELGPGMLFQVAVQARYHVYMAKRSYAELFGANNAPLPLPDPPEGTDGPSAFPAEVIEQAAQELFGAPPEYTRTAMSYVADGDYYQFGGGGLGEEWLPRIVSSERDGDTLVIRFEAWYEGGTFYDSEGKELVEEPRKIYGADMTVLLREDGTFQYQSVQITEPM